MKADEGDFFDRINKIYMIFDKDVQRGKIEFKILFFHILPV